MFGELLSVWKRSACADEQKHTAQWGTLHLAAAIHHPEEWKTNGSHFNPSIVCEIHWWQPRERQRETDLRIIFQRDLWLQQSFSFSLLNDSVTDEHDATYCTLCVHIGYTFNRWVLGFPFISNQVTLNIEQHFSINTFHRISQSMSSFFGSLLPPSMPF